MSTKSRARALRRHPEAAEVADNQALAAVGTSILSVVTLGLLEPETLRGENLAAASNQTAPVSQSTVG